MPRPATFGRDGQRKAVTITEGIIFARRPGVPDGEVGESHDRDPEHESEADTFPVDPTPPSNNPETKPPVLMYLKKDSIFAAWSGFQ
jgi:hypothetical protein